MLADGGLGIAGHRAGINGDLTTHRITPAIRTGLVAKLSTAAYKSASGGNMGLFMGAYLLVAPLQFAQQIFLFGAQAAIFTGLMRLTDRGVFIALCAFLF